MAIFNPLMTQIVYEANCIVCCCIGIFVNEPSSLAVAFSIVGCYLQQDRKQRGFQHEQRTVHTAPAKRRPRAIRYRHHEPVASICCRGGSWPTDTPGEGGGRGPSPSYHPVSPAELPSHRRVTGSHGHGRLFYHFQRPDARQDLRLLFSSQRQSTGGFSRTTSTVFNTGIHYIIFIEHSHVQLIIDTFMPYK